MGETFIEVQPTKQLKTVAMRDNQQCRHLFGTAHAHPQGVAHKVFTLFSRGVEHSAVQWCGSVGSKVCYPQGVGMQPWVGRGENESQVAVWQLNGRDEL